MDKLDLSPSKTHILAFPWPAAKGHINPMLHLCNRLVSKGLKVTIITEVSTVKYVKDRANSLINIESFLDGIDTNQPPPPDAAEAYFRRFINSASQALAELIVKHKISNDPPKVVLYDSAMPWVLEIAHEKGLRGAAFFTQSCSVCAVYYHMLQGTIKTPLEEPVVVVPALPPLESNDLPDFDSFIPGNMLQGTIKTPLEEPVVVVPALPPLESNDLPDFDSFIPGNQISRGVLLNQFSNIENADYILFNSFNKLEEEVVNWMANQCLILTIGPTASLIFLDNQLKTDKEDGNSLIESNTEACLKWLDERETGSVLYVAFGSFASLGEEQMKEVAEALIRSKCYFLWTLRAEEESKLPKDFKSETSEKGLIINWCPQLDVLAHGAVACFLTHCGWNSTLEALSSGVPMIAVPLWLDQTTNAKFIADVWLAGLRVKRNEKGIVTREEFGRCIREVTETEKGKELKRNAMKWKALAKEAVSEGGSSDRNIDEFVLALHIA